MAINYHDALLPRYGGLHATTWALFQGETMHGITWHRMTPEVDAGEILARREVPIPPDAGAWALNVACTEAAPASFPELLAGLETGTLVPRPQGAAGRSWFPGWRKPALGCVIPWDASAERVAAFVRCLDFGAADNPLGVPKLLAPGGVLWVRSLEILECRSGEPAGSVLAAGPEGIGVATATRDVRLPWDAKAEGLSLIPGVRLAAAPPEAGRFASRERALRRHEGFWTEVLEDLSPLAPPGFQADAGEGDQESLEAQVPAVVLDRLAALGPVDDVLLGAVLSWLGREVGEPFDVALGEPALRGEIVAAGWAGLLASRPPLRVAMGGAASFRTDLEALAAERRRRRARDTYPLDLPVRVRRLRSRPEIAPAVVVDLLGAGEEPPGLDPGTVLVVAIAADGRLTWRARPGDPGRLAGFVARFAGWLAALAEDPDRLPNHGPRNLPATVDERFREQAARAPDAVAIDADGEVWSYGRLAARAARLAAALRRRGVGPERLVALRVERLADLVTGLLGVLEAGGAFLVLDPREPPARLARLLTAARPWLALAGGAGTGEASGLPRISSDLPVHPLALADAPEGPAPGPGDPRPGSRLAYVAFTSGSTGAPKGVAVGHPGLARYIAAAGERFGLAAGDRLLQLGSPAFDLAYEQIFGALCHGATLVGLGGGGLPETAELLAACARSRVTVLDLPTAVWAQMARDVAQRALPVPTSVRRVVIGGEAARRASAEDWRRAAPGVRLLNTYGPTEATIVATWWEAPLAGDLSVGDTAEDTLPIGRPVPGVEAHVLGEDRRPVEDGEAGELWLGGAGLARGYHRRPELTAERFERLEDGRRLYRTGDRVRRRADGELEYLGRLDRQVKIAGHRVEPGEVEAALRGMAGVADAAVALAPGGARLQAWVVLDGTAEGSLGSVRAEAARSLPAWLRPSRFTAVAALPRTGAGKLDLAALREIPPEAEVPAIPREPVEAALARLWEKVLGAGRVESGDDFFALGGDSLSALALLGEIEAEFGRRVPVARLLAVPTLAALAAELRTPTPLDRPSCLVPLQNFQTAGSAPPFVCVHGLGGHLLRLIPLARAFAPHRAFLGLQSPGLDDGEPVPESLEELARIFLAGVRRELGEGPLHLGGMSFGGLVAFEMARQAVAAGIEVPFLALLDTDLSEVLPGRKPAPPSPRARLLGALRRFVGDRLGRIRRRLRHLRSGRDAAAKPNEYQGFSRVLRANEAALARYRPGPYAGRVTYFKASPWDPAVFPEFSALTGCELAIVPVPGDHLSQLEPPHVGTLAAELLARLDARPAAGAGSGLGERRQGVEPRGPAGRHVAGPEGHGEQEDGHGEEGPGVERRDLVEQAGEQAGEQGPSGQAQEEAEDDPARAREQDHPDDVRALRAESDAEAELVPPLGDGERGDAVHPQRGEDQAGQRRRSPGSARRWRGSPPWRRRAAPG